MSSMLRNLGREVPDLAALTGVRSGKRSYYREFQLSNERMQRTVRAMDSISSALVRTVEGPRALIEEVVRVAADHLQADWMMLALADGALPDSRPRFLAMDATRVFHDRIKALPAELRHELKTLRRTGEPPLDAGAGWVRVGMTLDGAPVGALIGRHGLEQDPDAADLSVLRILANQAAVSMHTSDLHQAGLMQRRRAQQLFDEVSQRSRDLTVRTDELRAAEQRLRAADQRELLDGERHRIALELHDSVAQFVLSAGLAIDVCRSEAERAALLELATRMAGAKELIGRASDQLRSVIYALHHARTPEDVASLPDLLQEMANQHRPHLPVTVRVEGRPIALGTQVEHALARTAGEALFNVAMHAQAGRAVVRLRYTEAEVSLFISDDGTGDPTAMRRQLRMALTTGPSDGRHRGLANMSLRAAEIGGTFAIRRSRLGGVRISVRISRSVPSRSEIAESAESDRRNP